MLMTTIDLLRVVLMYGVVPLWLIAGVADYACHRAARLERTSGTKESVLHLVQLAEVGGLLLAALFLQINAGVLIFMLAAFLAHQATAVWDVHYANQARRISPTEQHVHGVMEMLPATALMMVAIMHWPAVLSLFGRGPASFAPALKHTPLPAWYLASVIIAAAAVTALYVEELLRTQRGPRTITRRA